MISRHAASIFLSVVQLFYCVSVSGRHAPRTRMTDNAFLTKKYKMSVMMLMKERIAIPMFFPASAASSSSWATFLTTKQVTIEYRKLCHDSSYSMSSLSFPSAVLSCIMYSVMELKYFRALLMSLEPFSTSRALFKIILSLVNN